MHSDSPRVAVLIETSTSWGKDLVKGIVKYVRGSRHWNFHVDWYGVHEELRLPNGWRGDGIIARLTNKTLVRQILSLGIPAVNTSWSVAAHSNIPQVTTDERAMARLAAEHFLERGFKNFGYVGVSDQRNYVDHCGPTYAEKILARGFNYHEYRPQASNVKSVGPGNRFANLSRWLKKIPKPVAILAWDAVRGRLITESCRKLGLRVPEDVSVLVSFDDALMCEVSSPPLSGVSDCPELLGFEAAKVLDQMMVGKSPPKQPILIPPAGIIMRRSTDTLAHENIELTAAISYIRDNADKPIRVSDVLKKVPVSRRLLEQRFLQELGRSPAAEIRRMHLQRARELLVKTDLPISRVAWSSGFIHAEVMTRAFRRDIGVSPSTYRKEYRSR